MTVRFAFQGFRHNHIFDLYARASAHPRIVISGGSEEDAGTRELLQSEQKITITHADPVTMLDAVECDVVAIGDCYARRGSLAIEALRRGKHVMSDKPLCTSLQELGMIRELALEKNLSVICMLNLRDWGHFRELRRAVRDGVVGEVTGASFGGQHELKYSTRPSWYFEAAKHGGTLNDLAVHGVDLLQWVTGLRFSKITAARTWNARLPEVPHFQDGAQLMAELENGAGVLGDVSYFLPDGHGSSSPHYWRTTVWGTNGVIETSFGDRAVRFWRVGDSTPGQSDAAPDSPGDYLEAFLREIDGRARPGDLTTADSLKATHVALVAQEVADQQRHAATLDNPFAEREERLAAG